MIDEVLAAKDCKCSASLSLQTQQRRSCPPVATMDEPSAMQLIDEGEATHSCWRAAIFLSRGSPQRLLDLRSSTFAGMRGVRGAARAAARFESSLPDEQTKMKC